jgi:cobalamin synthase
MLTNLSAELAAVAPGRSHRAIWAATLAGIVIGAAMGTAVFFAWRPGAPLVAVLLVGLVIAAAIWLTRSGN